MSTPSSSTNYEGHLNPTAAAAATPASTNPLVNSNNMAPSQQSYSHSSIVNPAPAAAVAATTYNNSTTNTNTNTTSTNTTTSAVGIVPPPSSSTTTTTTTTLTSSSPSTITPVFVTPTPPIQHIEGIYSLYIINKAGGLIYQKDFQSKNSVHFKKLSTNDTLRLAATFHSLHAIAAYGLQVQPHTQTSHTNEQQTAAATTKTNHSSSSSSSTTVTNIQKPLFLSKKKEGINQIEAKDFRLQCFSTYTGIKFMIVASPNFPYLERILQNIYILYSDHVLKNPFYELEMPIRIETFDQALFKYISPLDGSVNFNYNPLQTQPVATKK